MRSLTQLAIPIYQTLKEKYPNVREREVATKKYILTEITHWSVKATKQPNGYFFKHKEFVGDKNSSPFEVRLVQNGPYKGMYELKFGNLNATTEEEMYRWDDEDPYRIQKALFLTNVLESKVAPLLQSGEIDAVVFSPYDGDGLGDQRYSYFYNMYSKIGKDAFDLQLIDASTYVITKKHQQ